MTAPAEDAKIRVGVGALVFRGDEILIVKRGRPPLEGQWSIPGGGVEFGEELEEAVRREVREETACEIRNCVFYKNFNSIHRNAQGRAQAHYLMIDFIADWAEGDPVAGDDAAEATFVPVCEAIDRIEWALTRNAVREAYAARQKARRGS